MERESQRDLEIVSTIAEGGLVTQRGLARKLGIALGLTNLYLKRLARKGYIKVTTIPPNRIKYLLTPKGILEKSRLTYEYMEYSLQLYRQARRALRESLVPLAQAGHRRVVLCGTGEAAELAYLTLRELGAGAGGSRGRRWKAGDIPRFADPGPGRFPPGERGSDHRGHVCPCRRAHPSAHGAGHPSREDRFPQRGPAVGAGT